MRAGMQKFIGVWPRAHTGRMRRIRTLAAKVATAGFEILFKQSFESSPKNIGKGARINSGARAARSLRESPSHLREMGRGPAGLAPWVGSERTHPHRKASERGRPRKQNGARLQRINAGMRVVLRSGLAAYNRVSSGRSPFRYVLQPSGCGSESLPEQRPVEAVVASERDRRPGPQPTELLPGLCPVLEGLAPLLVGLVADGASPS